MLQRRAWRDLSPGQRLATILLGGVQLALLTAAQVDIWRRPAHEVRGRRWVWATLAFVNFLGPLAYFAFGRRR
jgi:hypothetical protein